MKYSKSVLAVGILSALLVAPVTAFNEGTVAIAILGSTPFAQQNYGTNVVKGRAKLTAKGTDDAGKTKVVVKLSGLKPGTTHIGHIHGGTCASLTPGQIFHNLEAVVANSSGEGTSYTEVPEGMQGFADCGWWVAFHEGPINTAPQTPAIAVGPVITHGHAHD